MQQFLYSIDNILTPDECKYYIGFFSDPEKVEHINDTHRKYHRVQFVDENLANHLYSKIQAFIPKKIKKISVILFVSILVFSCGKKDDPIFNDENQNSKIFSTQHISLT